jgi:hypothetical protein
MVEQFLLQSKDFRLQVKKEPADSRCIAAAPPGKLKGGHQVIICRYLF